MTDAYGSDLDSSIGCIFPMDSATPVSPQEVYSPFLGVKLYFGGDGVV